MDENKEKEFIKRYSELCEETGYRIAVKPVWKPRDDGTWSTVLVMSTEKLPAKNIDI